MIIAAEINSREYIRKEIENSNNRVIIHDKKYYICKPNNHVISDKYDYMSDFKNNLAVVEKNGKKGVINSDGVVVIKPQFDNAYIDAKAIRICNKNKWGIANFSGRILLKPTYNFIEAFTNNYSRAHDDEKWGVIDRRGRTIIRFKYSYLGSLKKDVIIARKVFYGGIDLKENEIVPFKYRTMRLDGDKTILSNSYKDNDNETFEI